MSAFSATGLISGIDTSSLITKLLSLDAAPVSLLQTRVASDQTLGTTYAGLGTSLQTLQTTAQSLEKPQAFGATTATSSDPSVLTATTTDGASAGTYALRVARTVSTQQLVSGGFADATTAKVGAGTITIGQGSGTNLATPTTLADLNGGAGVTRGQFRITDRSGASAVIDTGSAVTLDDVVADINSATTVSVRASVSGNHLVLTDTSGRTSSNLIVQDLGTGTAAASLGIAANTNAATVTGTSINTLGRDTLLGQLNDGRGVTLGSGGATGDFTITARNGAAYNVSLANVTTVGGAIDAIAAATGGKVTASVAPGGSGLRLVDSTIGIRPLTITQNNGSRAAAGLGLTAAAVGNTITGTPVLGGIDTTLLSSLNGGAGLTLGRVTITDRSGGNHTVDLSAATDVQAVIAAINAGTGGKVTASLKASGNGIQLTDVSGGTGPLTAADADATAAATALGLAGTSAGGTLSGKDLGKQWVAGSTPLSGLNGGAGVGAGTFKITNAAGAETTVTVDSTVTTVAQLLYQINSKGLAGVTAKVNAAGNGIELDDASGGAGHLAVADESGTAAADLNLKGTATGTAINGAYSKSITVGANDTLTSVAAAINAAGAGVRATVISDGSATAPYRLSLTADHSGTAGAVVFDDGSTGLGTQTLVAGQDAAVFIGGSTAAGSGSSASAGSTVQPVLVTSGTDSITNVIPGVSLNLVGAGPAPVQLTVAADPSSLVTSLQTFTTTFNALSTSISSQSTFNSSSGQGGLLLGDPVALDINSNIYDMLDTTVATNEKYKTLYSVGFGIDGSGALTFDADKFQAAFAADPADVQSLFNATAVKTDANGKTTTTNTGVAYAMDQVLTKLVDPVSGSVTAAQKELTTEEQGFTDQITSLNALLAQKKQVYETQFANMESALATLQSQSSVLGSVGTLKASTSSSGGSSSGG